jgi:6-phosphogluconate dehydrogenase
MPQHLAQIGIVGLGTMGANLARNFSSKGIKIAVYNRTSIVTDKFYAEFKNENILPVKTLSSLVKKLEANRIIFLVVKTGAPVDALISSLAPLLSTDDIIIDLGNSYYKDTERREKYLKNYGIHFYGCGISGGEKGALNGPSLMPGGPKKHWNKILPFLEKVAAKDFAGQPCTTYIGSGGSGHYVKMVHNGIEYGIMQSMAEAYQILRVVYQLQAPEIANIFNQFNKGKLNSFLFELAAKVLNKKDTNKTSLIDKILDQAEQKGTGNWTAIESLNLAVAGNIIIEAVTARVISSQKSTRTIISKNVNQQRKPPQHNINTFTKKLEDALLFTMIMSFIQGFNLILVASKQYKWNIDIAEISRIWQGGCIIKAEVLKDFNKNFKKKSPPPDNILESKEILSILSDNQQNLRDVIEEGIRNKIAVPALSAALSYFDSNSTLNGSANFIQALRDAFGAHSFQRTDKEGTFHADWD